MHATIKKYYFKCPKGIHVSELQNINGITRGQEGSITCNQCASFAQWGYDNICEDFLEKYWDYEKNTVSPWKISYGENSAKIWIKCKNIDKQHHGSYETICSSFSNMNARCPYCDGKKVHILDSLGTLYPQVLDIWSDKNEKTPYEYTPKSTRKVYWKCTDSKHKDYHRSIHSSNNYEFRCPECIQERDESFLQEKVRLYLESLNIGDILHEHKCTIVPKNPKTKKGNNTLPFDNEIRELKLVIEVMGLQHYQIGGYINQQAKHNGTTPGYELHMQKVRDRYKKFIAYKQGYEYLAIPYWTDNKSKDYKTLIDDKIKEILHGEVVNT